MSDAITDIERGDYANGPRKRHKLKPCPFCGSEAHAERPNRGVTMVYCSNAECQTHPSTGWCYDEHHSAVDDWNKRPATGWVACAIDQMPPICPDVLVRVQDEHGDCWHEIAYWPGWDHGWYDGTTGKPRTAEGVITHWAPLLPLPSLTPPSA